MGLPVQPALGAGEDDPAIVFKVRPLNIDANEGMAAGDVDRDGKIDLIAGRNWYSGKDWTPRSLRQIEDWNGYVQSNGDFLFDVNDDGWLDVISGSFIPTVVHWYENPRAEGLRLGKHWKEHVLMDTKASANEGQLLEDIDGDGQPEWIVNSWKAENPMTVWRLVRKSDGVAEKAVQDNGSEPGRNKKKTEETGRPAMFEAQPHVLGKVNGHGVAVGDLNGDGKNDVLVGHGWYEQPPSDPWSQGWVFHEDWTLHSSLPMIVADLDGDGDSDLVYGNAHDYGLHWKEQIGNDSAGKILWKEHLIDDSFSQPHCLLWVDLDAHGTDDPDAQRELVTGKRYFGHNGRDPGGMEMPCLYYYRFDRTTKSFQRYTIDEGHVGTGLQVVAQDLNGNGKVDLAVAGKSGTFLLEAE
ncbi:MAG: FG-GAP repeat protein [Planctomycetota bacterium]